MNRQKWCADTLVGVFVLTLIQNKCIKSVMDILNSGPNNKIFLQKSNRKSQYLTKLRPVAVEMCKVNKF